jgi:ABC-type transport system involved in multi-copper enzyme maturation permease subunit
MNVEPILRSDLTRTARCRRHYGLRAAIGLIPLVAVWRVYSQWDRDVAGRGLRWGEIGSLPGYAELGFLELAWWSGVAILLVVPGLVGGSIAAEDRRGTMRDLLASPLSSVAIVVGKLAARLVQLAVVLAVVLPMVVPMVVLGLLDAETIAGAVALLLALTVFVGALSILVATVVRRPRRAIPLAYVLVGGWLVLPAWYWLATTGGRLGLGGRFELEVWLGHPGRAAAYLWGMIATKWYYPPGFPGNRAAFLREAPPTVGFQTVYSALFLLMASVCLRPLRLGLWGWPGRRRASSPRPRPAVGEDPMLWKERYAPGRLPGKTVLLFVLLSAGLLVPLAAPAWDAFREWRASWYGETIVVGACDRLNHVVRQLNAGLYLLVLAVVAATAASSVTGERERGTWSSLATTLVSGAEVARAKAAGALWSARAWSIPLLVLGVLGLATGAVHPLGVLAAAAAILIFVRYAAALGVLFSMVSRSSEQALAATFLTLLASNAAPLLLVPVDLIGPLAGSWQAVALAGLTPLVQWVAPVAPVEIQCWLEGRAWEANLQLPGLFWGARMALGPGLIRTYLVSLAVHGLGAGVLIRAAAWWFDHKRGDREAARLLGRAGRRDRGVVRSATR